MQPMNIVTDLGRASHGRGASPAPIDVRASGSGPAAPLPRCALGEILVHPAQAEWIVRRLCACHHVARRPPRIAARGSRPVSLALVVRELQALSIAVRPVRIAGPADLRPGDLLPVGGADPVNDVPGGGDVEQGRVDDGRPGDRAGWAMLVAVDGQALSWRHAGRDRPVRRDGLAPAAPWALRAEAAALEA